MSKYSTVGEILLELVIPELWNTIYMLAFTTIIALILGCVVALVMICTRENGLKPNRYIFGTLEVMVDILMSMPFTVLAVALIPLTRLLVGTCIGRTAALVPLSIVTVPMFAKFIYDAMLEVNPWTIQAAKSFGASDFQILKIMLRESVPAVISGTTLSTITVLGSTAMLGAVGAGGIGAVAINYGYKRSDYLIIYVVVVVLIIFTQSIQMGGEYIYKKRR